MARQCVKLLCLNDIATYLVFLGVVVLNITRTQSSVDNGSPGKKFDISGDKL